VGQVRFVLRLEGSSGVLYDRARHEYQRLTTGEALLLSSVARWRFERGAALVGANLGPFETDRALSSVRRRGLLDEHGRFDGHVVELEPAGGTYAAPLAAHIGLTTACNFACRHCYSSSGARSANELTTEEIEMVLDELAAIGCQQLVLGGGEPFLRKDLARIVARANALGLDVYVHTNASLITEAMLDELLAWPPTGLTVSLDGPTRETNDRVRGEGAFDATMKALVLLRRRYAPGFAISTTVTGPNAAHMSAMVDLAKREGANLLLLRPPFPSGRIVEDRALMCDLETFWSATGAARRRAEAIDMEINCTDEGGAVLPTDFEGFGCIAGHVVLGITPTGDVTPCLNLPGDFVAGNVRTTSVLGLWRNGAPFTRLRAMPPAEDCVGCADYDICRGGCRIRAIDAGRGAGGRDPWCYRDVKRAATPFVGSAQTFAPPERRMRLRIIDVKSL
jgi:radical SAM protein with 4Fe4S-binding SPASM domain